MKIRSVAHNNRKKVFEVSTATRKHVFPFSKAEPAPTVQDPIDELFVDREAGREAFTYILRSGRTGTVHAEQVLDYNQDPTYLRDLLLYRLTLEARKRVAQSPLSKRELARRLDTSAAQLYRLLDQTNYRKSLDQVLALLRVLDCEVDLVVRAKTASIDIDASDPLLERADAAVRSLFESSLGRPLALREKRPKYLAKAGRPRKKMGA